MPLLLPTCLLDDCKGHWEASNHVTILLNPLGRHNDALVLQCARQGLIAVPTAKDDDQCRPTVHPAL